MDWGQIGRDWSDYYEWGPRHWIGDIGGGGDELRAVIRVVVAQSWHCLTFGLVGDQSVWTVGWGDDQRARGGVGFEEYQWGG